MKKLAKAIAALGAVFSIQVFAAEGGGNILDDLDPRDPSTYHLLHELDEEWERQTGTRQEIEETPPLVHKASGCFRHTCGLWAQIVRATQTLHLYIHGRWQASWKVSTGIRGYETPDFDRHPNGRIYDRYNSVTYPGGDYRGLGNMPYAVFISGGYAIHGTTASNWRLLGRPASHGCIRLHPDHARNFNLLVRAYGARDTWITVQAR